MGGGKGRDGREVTESTGQYCIRKWFLQYGVSSDNKQVITANGVGWYVTGPSSCHISPALRNTPSALWSAIDLSWMAWSGPTTGNGFIPAAGSVSHKINSSELCPKRPHGVNIVSDFLSDQIFQITRNITSHSMKDLAFDSLLKWKTINNYQLSLHHWYIWLFKRLRDCMFWTWGVTGLIGTVIAAVLCECTYILERSRASTRISPGYNGNGSWN